MSGVYIKGMEMPTDEARAFTIVFSDGKAAISVEPFEWHEVVPVPPHGRLGDLEALAEDVEIFADENAIGKIEKEELLEIVKYFPTIIPAGKKEE